jgi:hypothetical protein
MPRELIQSIHDTPGLWVIAATGGGSGALSGLLEVSGASRTLIEATIPYAPPALASYLGHAPLQAAGPATARAMAMAAFQRCRVLQGDLPAPLFGLGCCAALTTDRTRRGTDRCFVAVQSLTTTFEASLTLTSNQRDRPAQEALCAELIWRIMHQAQLAIGPDAGAEVHSSETHDSGTNSMAINSSKIKSLNDDDLLSQRQAWAPVTWQALFDGVPASTWPSAAAPQALFPGSFNPLHDGHKQMAAIAAEHLGAPVVLEVSAFNVDKPPLDYLDLQQREAGTQGLPIIFTNAPTFVQKSDLFPGVTFVVGSDTIERIADPKYYDDRIDQRDVALALLSARGHKFLVFGRIDGQHFVSLNDLDLPKTLRELCTAIPESQFRIDLASRDLRQAPTQNE